MEDGIESLNSPVARTRTTPLDPRDNFSEVTRTHDRPGADWGGFGGVEGGGAGVKHTIVAVENVDVCTSGSQSET